MGNLVAAPFGALLEGFDQSDSEGPYDDLNAYFTLFWDGQDLEMRMETADWDALAEFRDCVPRLLIELRFGNDVANRPLSSPVPPAFIVGLCQHSFDLQLEFFEDYGRFFIDLAQQIHKVHALPISPFALRCICVPYIRSSDIAVLVRLGRAGPDYVWPEHSDPDWDHTSVLERSTILTAPLEDNFWLVLEMIYGCPWFGSNGSHSPRHVEDTLLEGEWLARLKPINARNEALRDSTHAAFRTLLPAARLLLCALPVPSPDTTQPSLDSPPASSSFPQRPTSLPSSTPSISYLISSSSSSLASSPRSAIFPILHLPFEILDLILSSFSPGCLSSKQHRIVMNWTEDRSTLGVNKPSSRHIFLRKMNCWKWESEVERVNLGHGYE